MVSESIAAVTQCLIVPVNVSHFPLLLKLPFQSQMSHYNMVFFLLQFTHCPGMLAAALVNPGPLVCKGNTPERVPGLGRKQRL